MSQLDDGQKEPETTSGAPFPPATEHSDGPADRPRRDVPPADNDDDDGEPAGDEPGDEHGEESDA